MKKNKYEIDIVEENKEPVSNEVKAETEGQVKKTIVGKGTIAVIAIIVATIIVFFLGAYFFIDSALNKSVINVFDTYTAAKDELREEIQQNVAEISESYYHISNNAVIKIGDLKKISNLEVLKVRDSEYSLTTGNELQNTLWIKVTETCEYVVDLTAAEFVVDNVRNTVVVRAPAPEPRNFAMEGEPEELFSYSTFFSGDSTTGRALLETQTEEADAKIKEKILSNQDYYNSAKEEATKMITYAITALNPEIEDLKIVVEFFE